MIPVRKESDYTVIATKYQSEKINIYIACKGEKKLANNLYILNEIPYESENINLFKTLFFIYSSKNKPKEFCDFFVQNDNFYSVFKYKESPNITQKYDKELSTSHFDERCRVLEHILMKVEQVNKLPKNVAACVTELENICVDDEKNIIFNYNLKNINSYPENDTKLIYKHIHDIIFTILRQECEAGFNKQLHIVLDKCKKNVYSSIPEMIVDLKKAEKISKSSSWWGYIKSKFELKKPIISKASRVALITTIVFGTFYLVYSKLSEGQKRDLSATFSIGNLIYNANTSDSSEKAVSSENEDNQASTKSQGETTLTKGLDIAYDDYIVQKGDTVSSICESYYNDVKFVTAVSTFNGISINENLTPGSILKLPNRTAIALYSTK